MPVANPSSATSAILHTRLTYATTSRNIAMRKTRAYDGSWFAASRDPPVARPKDIFTVPVAQRVGGGGGGHGCQHGGGACCRVRALVLVAVSSRVLETLHTVSDSHYCALRAPLVPRCHQRQRPDHACAACPARQLTKVRRKTLKVFAFVWSAAYRRSAPSRRPA
jgi:hypothetical protein